MVVRRPTTFRDEQADEVAARAAQKIERVPRADVAAFMRDQLTDDRFLGRAPSLQAGVGGSEVERKAA